MQHAAVDGFGHRLTLGVLGGLTPRPPCDLAEAVRRFVDGHLHESLSPQRLAAQHHVSLRTLQRTLRAQGTSPAALVRARRLDAVRGDLENPRLAHLTVSAVARRRGVTDLPWLSRAFRDRFGCTPGSIRRAGPAPP